MPRGIGVAGPNVGYVRTARHLVEIGSLDQRLDTIVHRLDAVTSVG